MKRWYAIFFAAILPCGLSPFAMGNATLTSDPLTGLPLIPATDSRLHMGNEPTRIPDSMICKSKFQADLYVVFDSKMDATLAWYAARLPGFRKTQAYASKRMQHTFYKPDGTVIVSVTGNVGLEGENTNTYSVIYGKLDPGLSEKSILGMNEQRIVCK